MILPLENRRNELHLLRLSTTHDADAVNSEKEVIIYSLNITTAPALISWRVLLVYLGVV